MIIQINATVCAALDHGEGGRRKIAGSDSAKEVQGGRKGASDQEKQEITGERGNNVGSYGGPTLLWLGPFRCAEG